MATARLARTADENRVLSEAVARVARCWKLTNEQLGAILGLSSATVSRLHAGGFRLNRSNKAFELGQYLVRLFRSLDSLMGSDDAAAISWLRTANLDLGARPVDLIRTIRGLSDVADYVDDYRARV
ncbi:RNA polymerase RpoN-/SigL-like sigma 54 subunit [Hephaestia caeni]|uniref:RNA polymerase RpoN-/SigL-like sigma 54 subunit n=1 Tax=Hephaestia caeni TaxID=645617 RepID=A0A397P4U2_9SPHN|nr:MbcA/ParS/Xre antitoxin family protein [Hephaestia caeni]RIA43898.1 RNA polymerase RpoN-/SigL-like sigma 54 subunit [Hephaestia caeni]